MGPPFSGSIWSYCLRAKMWRRLEEREKKRFAVPLGLLVRALSTERKSMEGLSPRGFAS
jgi:hypothetical protein